MIVTQLQMCFYCTRKPSHGVCPVVGGEAQGAQAPLLGLAQASLVLSPLHAWVRRRAWEDYS